MTPEKLSMMFELSQRIAPEPGTDGEKKGEGGRVTIGLAWRQYSFPVNCVETQGCIYTVRHKKLRWFRSVFTYVCSGFRRRCK